MCEERSDTIWGSLALKVSFDCIHGIFFVFAPVRLFLVLTW